MTPQLRSQGAPSHTAYTTHKKSILAFYFACMNQECQGRKSIILLISKVCWSANCSPKVAQLRSLVLWEEHFFSLHHSHFSPLSLLPPPINEDILQIFAFLLMFFGAFLSISYQETILICSFYASRIKEK